MHPGKVKLSERLAVHRRTGHQHALAHQWLVLLLPVNLYLRTDEGDDGLRIGLGANHIELVADMEDSVAVGKAHMSVVQNARANEVAVQEVVHLHQRLALQIGIRYLHVHLMGLHVGVLAFKPFQVLFFFLQTNPADIAHGNRGTDDAHHTERIGTGITRCYLRQIAAENGIERLVGRTKTRSVGHGTIERTHHHWQVMGIAGVEENVVASEHHQDIKQNGRSSQQVQFYTRRSETLEEARSHLQTNHEDKQHEAEILNERKNADGSREADVSCQDSGKKHKGDSK